MKINIPFLFVLVAATGLFSQCAALSVEETFRILRANFRGSPEQLRNTIIKISKDTKDICDPNLSNARKGEIRETVSRKIGFSVPENISNDDLIKVLRARGRCKNN